MSYLHSFVSGCSMGKKTTPAQQQYLDLKREYSDCLVLFRMGDFYELFYDDAKTAHDVLHITLTSRNKNSDDPIPMAGIPYHALERYLPKLVKAGYKVAIAEQVGDVVPGKVVEREVVQVVTPGTWFEDEQRVYIGAIAYGGPSQHYHLARGDVSVGKYWTQSFQRIEACLERIESLGIGELIIEGSLPQSSEISSFVTDRLHISSSFISAPHDANGYLSSILGTQGVDGYGQSLVDGRQHALASLFAYVEQNQKHQITAISSIGLSGEKEDVHLDKITLKNLEVFVSAYEGSKKHSLYHVINTCRTPMGTRLLAERLSHPHAKIDQLQEAHNQIDIYVNRIDAGDRIRQFCAGLIDIPRRINSILYGRSTYVHYIELRNILHSIFCTSDGQYVLSEMMSMCDDLTEARIASLREFVELLVAAFVDETEIKQGVYIAQGFDQEIDELVHLAFSSDQEILDYQQALVAKTNIHSLKVKYISNQGYTVEVSKKDCTSFEQFIDSNDQQYDFVRRQTLKSVERYTSSYLYGLQQRSIDAKEQLQGKQAAVVEKYKAMIEEMFTLLSLLCDCLARIDLASSFADYAIKNNWCKPSLHDGYDLIIQDGRHPVVEKYLPSTEEFIPNDLSCKYDDQRLLLLTGPNMGGKSTYLRQNAIIVLLAHAGLWVPASSATIPLVDGLFARVGSGDALAKNQSTFMTEMLEMANIIHQATERSFVILDELGRGTSTYDGLSLARSIVEYMHSETKCKTIFATHYHELLHLEEELQGCVNIRVDVYETDTSVVFLKKIAMGGANKSYGLDVAKLAGIPGRIIQRAQEVLHGLERKQGDLPVQSSLGFDFSPVLKEKDKIRQKLTGVDVDSMTPMQAINFLHELKQDIESEK